MNFQELLEMFWIWWVTNDGLFEYDASLFGTRAVQLIMVVAGVSLLLALILNKKLRSFFF